MKRLLLLFVLACLTSAAWAATPACVAGASGVAPVATLTFTAPTTNTDGTAISTPLTFNVYEGTASGAETKVASGLATSPVVINTGMKDATTYYFYVTVTDANGNSSAPSNEGCKSFPAGVPGIVVITIS